MSPPVELVLSDPHLPTHTDVVIIGGEQSSRNWGWCHTIGRKTAEIPLAMESLRLWRGMNARIGRDTGFRQPGLMYLCATEAEIARQAAWLDQARPYRVDARLLRGGGLEAVMPGAGKKFMAGLYTPTDGCAEPAQAAPALAEAARARGAVILTGCAVRGLDLQAGRIAGVVTERGRVRCQAVVLAGGAWSRLFCGNMGIDFPQLTILASVCRTRPLTGAPAITAAGSVFAFRKRLDGGYSIARRNANTVEIGPDHVRLLADFLPQLRTNRHEFRLRIGRRSWAALRTRRRWSLDEATPFEAMRVLDPAPRQGILAEARSVLARAFPAFARMEVAQSWGGMIDVTPDALPVMDRVVRLPGFFIATGFSGDGFGTGPGAGRLMAEIVTGATPGVDPTPFRLDRFARTQAPPTG